MAISQARQVIQQEPVTVFLATDVGTKLKRLSTTGTGLTRKTVWTLDLSGASASLQFEPNFFNAQTLPVAERDGYHMIVPINFEIGKHYQASLGSEQFVDFGGSTQWFLSPLGNLLTTSGQNTQLLHAGYDTEGPTFIYMGGAINLNTLSSVVIGMPIYGQASSGSFVPVNGNFNNLTYTMSRCLKAINWRIVETASTFDGNRFVADGFPLVYGDFN